MVKIGTVLFQGILGLMIGSCEEHNRTRIKECGKIA